MRSGDKHLWTPEAPIYEFGSSAEIVATVANPDERVGEAYMLSVYGRESARGEHASSLADHHARDKRRTPRYRKIRGQLTPIYEPPKGIGFLQHRGTRAWSGAVWLAPHTVSDMLALLPHVRPLYLGIQELKEGRHRSIVSSTLQTSDPAEE